MQYKKKSILFIAPSYLIENSAVGRCCRPFINQLAQNGFDVNVVCRPGTIIVPSLVNVYVVRERFFLSFFYRVISHFGYHHIFNRPDELKLTWNGRAYNMAVRIIQKKHCQFVHSISFPCSAQIVALRLKQLFGIKWIAQFYDPWVGNPIRRVPEGWKQKDSFFERETAKFADLVLHISSGTLDIWRTRYPNHSSKFYLLPLTAVFPKRRISVHNDGAFKFVHIGNLSKSRNSVSFLSGLFKIISSGLVDRKKIQVVYVGDVPEIDLKYIREHNLLDVVNNVGRIPESECASYYEEADAFLAFDCQISEYNEFYPSKIVKYFYYQKPILGITTNNSVLYRELSASNNFSCTYDSDIQGVIMNVIHTKENPSSNDMEYWHQYTPEVVGSKYEDLVSKL